MTYVKQTWTDDVTEVDKLHMDHIEDGLVALDTGGAQAKGQPNGYAGLGADGKVPATQLPAASSPIPPIVNGQWLKGVGGAAVWAPLTAADIPSLALTYQVVSEKGVASGYASLGTDGKVPATQLPSTTPPTPPGPVDTGWQGLALNSGWAASSSAYTPLRVRKIDGVVNVQGMIVWTGGGSEPGGSAQITTLPAGFRPAYILIANCVTAGNAYGVSGRVDIQATGETYYIAGANVYNFLSMNISFIADQ